MKRDIDRAIKKGREIAHRHPKADTTVSEINQIIDSNNQVMDTAFDLVNIGIAIGYRMRQLEERSEHGYI